MDGIKVKRFYLLGWKDSAKVNSNLTDLTKLGLGLSLEGVGWVVVLLID